MNVSTDLATSLYYAGRPDESLAQLERSLAIDPRHGQTLFNVGIVRRDGKNDARGAITAWERLLASVPDYPEAGKVRTMIAELKTRVSSAAGNPSRNDPRRAVVLPCSNPRHPGASHDASNHRRRGRLPHRRRYQAARLSRPSDVRGRPAAWSTAKYNLLVRFVMKRIARKAGRRPTLRATTNSRTGRRSTASSRSWRRPLYTSRVRGPRHFEPIPAADVPLVKTCCPIDGILFREDGQDARIDLRERSVARLARGPLDDWPQQSDPVAQVDDEPLDPRGARVGVARDDRRGPRPRRIGRVAQPRRRQAGAAPSPPRDPLRDGVRVEMTFGHRARRASRREGAAQLRQQGRLQRHHQRIPVLDSGPQASSGASGVA